jgi:hypothetical protein
MKWAPLRDCPCKLNDVGGMYIQTIAVLNHVDRNMIVASLSALALTKSYQDKGEEGMAYIFAQLADDLIEEGYCTSVIMEGCKRYRKSGERFFPTFDQLRRIMHPIQYRLNRTAQKLEATLKFSKFTDM